VKSFLSLQGAYPGEKCWIVGKGPSLEFLRAEHFGVGPVIALNQAIAMVEPLEIPNPIYSLQKDGCGVTEPHHICAERDGHPWMLSPQRATLILQSTPGYSRYCLERYEPKLFVDPVHDLKFKYPQTMAVRMAVAMARFMGCTQVKLVCCDSLVNGNLETFNIWTRTAERTSAGDHYDHGRNRILRELVKVRHEFVIPKGALV
jgi:hypothetical protein